jgi:hypothetical protein
MIADNFNNFNLSGSHQNLAYIGFNGAFPHMHNHGQAVDISQRFSRQPARRHPGRNDDNGIFGFNHEMILGAANCSAALIRIAAWERNN